MRCKLQQYVNTMHIIHVKIMLTSGVPNQGVREDLFG